MSIFRPLIDAVGFVFFHLILLPWLIDLTPADRYFPIENVVTAEELNVRADSTMNGFAAGYLKEGTRIDILHHGRNWHEIDLQKYHQTASREEVDENRTGKWFVSAGYVTETPKDVAELYIEGIILAHIICFIFLLVVKFKRFHRVIWYHIASINTIPMAIGLMLDMLMNLVFKLREKTQKTETADMLD